MVVREMSMRGKPVGWVSLKDCYAYALAFHELELGIEARRGSDRLQRRPPNDQWAPDRTSLSRMIAKAPDVDHDPGDEEVDSGGETLTLEELAAVEAHFTVLGLLQKGVAADGIVRDGVARSFLDERKPLPRDLWCGPDWKTLDDGTAWQAGPIPDYANSRLEPWMDWATGVQVEVDAIQVDGDRVFAELGAFPAPPEVNGGIFRWNSGKWEVACGGRRAELQPTKGLCAIAVLLACKGDVVPWSVLPSAAERVSEGVEPRKARDTGGYVSYPTEARRFDPGDFGEIRANLHAQKTRTELAQERDDIDKQIAAIMRRIDGSHTRQQEELRKSLEWLVAEQRRLKNSQKRVTTKHDNDRTGLARLVRLALQQLARACPPFVGHFGWTSGAGRKTLVTVKGGWKYVPGKDVSWDTTPVGGLG